MDIFYQRDLNQNYMILPSEENDEKETYEKRMVLNNAIGGLLSMDTRTINGELFYYYNIHSLQSIQIIFEHRLFDRETLMQLFCGITKVFRTLERYLLSADNLFLKPECVYMDIESGEVFLCFYPCKKAGRDTFKELAEFLIDRVNHGEDDAKELAYAYYEKVHAEEYDPEKLIEQIERMEAEKDKMQSSMAEVLAGREETGGEEFYFVEPEEEENKEQMKLPLFKMFFCIGVILLAAGLYLILLSDPEILSFVGLSQEDYIVIGAVMAVAAVMGMIAVMRRPVGKKDLTGQEDKESRKEYCPDFLEEEIEDKEEHFGETAVLSVSVKKVHSVPQLKGVDGDEERKFTLDKNPFIIGKLSGKVNGILTDSRVSRVHAAIREDSGEYYISDLNSTNGTYINGKRLNGTETVQLHHMDKVCMASVEMIFLCQ